MQGTKHGVELQVGLEIWLFVLREDVEGKSHLQKFSGERVRQGLQESIFSGKQCQLVTWRKYLIQGLSQPSSLIKTEM